MIQFHLLIAFLLLFVFFRRLLVNLSKHFLFQRFQIIKSTCMRQELIDYLPICYFHVFLKLNEICALTLKV
jgi:hypothetical protein